MTEKNKRTTWIGTKTGGDHPGRGIYRTRLDLESGSLSEPERVAELTAPGFLTTDSAGKHLYAIYRDTERGEGGVAAFRVNGAHDLSLLGRQHTGCGKPAHVSVDRDGTCVYSAQYSAGTIASFPVTEDGGVGAPVEQIQHHGSGPNEARQESAHPHWTGVDPSGRFLYVPDLGADEIVRYRRTEACGLERSGSIPVEPGSGPRHMVFHPTLPRAYVIFELAEAVTVFDYDDESGKLDALQTVSTLSGVKPKRASKASEIRVHPGGGFVFAGNRGHDTITVFGVDEEDGRLAHVEREPIRGAWPRNFHVDPTGAWLVAAGQETNTITTFRIDGETGRLTYSGHAVNVPDPICVDFQPAETA